MYNVLSLTTGITTLLWVRFIQSKSEMVPACEFYILIQRVAIWWYLKPSDTEVPSHACPILICLLSHAPIPGTRGFVNSSKSHWRRQKLLERGLPGAVMAGPARDKVMKKIPGRQSHLGPHPWRGHEERTWQARPSRIRYPPGWPRPLPHPVSSPLSCCWSCSLCCGFLCCLPRALLLLFHWVKTNLKP